MTQPKNNKTHAIVRLVVLGLLIINQALVSFGFEPLPFTEEEIYSGVSSIALGAMAIYSWWKNNNVKREALQAQKELERKQAKK